MAEFSWTNAAGGDWSEATNWVFVPGRGPGSPPPGAGDVADFDDLANSYTVTVTGTVSAGLVDPFLTIDAVSPLRDVAFSISGTLMADFRYTTNTGGPATSMTIEAGGALIVPALLFSDDVFETVTIAGTGAGGFLELGNLTVGGIISGKNSLMILDFDNASPTALNTGVIQFDNVTDLSINADQTITNVAGGDKFIFEGAGFTGDTVSLDTTTHDLTVMNGATTVFTMDDVNLEAGYNGGFEVVNGNTIEASFACYVRGTMINTPAGDVAVETLRPGMQVSTLVDGETVPRTIKWVGHRRIDLTRHPRADTVAPIRIERDAYADNVPQTDLLLSPDHAIFIDGMLICIRQLVNGSTIRKERGWAAVDYYHVELDQHGILLAEGMPVESYLDTGNRGFFMNDGTPPVLHPNLPSDTQCPTREAGSCAPFVSDEASVQPVWQRLFDRAAAIGRPGSQRGTTTDADLRLLADRRTIKPVFSDSNRVVFVLPRNARGVQLISRAQSPTEARPWLGDQRRLGVRVKRIVLRGADEAREISMDHPDITRGWWAVEHDGPIMSRWTDGAAVLPLLALRGNVTLEIHLAGEMTYVLDASPGAGPSGALPDCSLMQNRPSPIWGRRDAVDQPAVTSCHHLSSRLGGAMLLIESEKTPK